MFLLTHYIRSWRFCRKTRFEASQVVFWSLSCYKELKLTTNLFTGCTLHGLLIQMQNISLRSSRMLRKQNFDLGVKSDTAVLTFTFHFLSFPLFSLFLPLFFSLAGHLVGFISAGRVLRKAFRILGLGERKGRWTMEQDFHGDLQVNLTWFFLPFSPVSLTELCSFWYGLKDLFTLHKLADKVVLDR